MGEEMNKLLKKSDVATLLGIHPESVMRLSREGRFPSPIKFNTSTRGHVRFDEADVVAWLQQRKNQGGGR